MSHQNECVEFIFFFFRGVISLFIETEGSSWPVLEASRDFPRVAVVRQLDGLWLLLTLSSAKKKKGEKNSRMRKLFGYSLVCTLASHGPLRLQPRENNGRKAYLVFAIIYNKIHFGVLPSTRRANF